MKSNQSFEEYLAEVHAEQYVGLDDDMPDDFDFWISGLEQDELIKYADIYGKKMLLLGQAMAYNKSMDIIKKA